MPLRESNFTPHPSFSFFYLLSGSCCIFFPTRVNHLNCVFFSLTAPHLPPHDVQILNTSSTSLKITWNRPANRTGGLIRGYRIFYFPSSKLNEFLSNGGLLNRSWVRNVTVRNTTHLMHEIHGLKIYTTYCAVVLVFTIQDGPVSKPVCKRTDEDGT